MTDDTYPTPEQLKAHLKWREEQGITFREEGPYLIETPGKDALAQARAIKELFKPRAFLFPTDELEQENADA